MSCMAGICQGSVADIAVDRWTRDVLINMNVVSGFASGLGINHIGYGPIVLRCARQPDHAEWDQRRQKSVDV
jgi:hypothetical protein